MMVSVMSYIISRLVRLPLISADTRTDYTSSHSSCVAAAITAYKSVTADSINVISIVVGTPAETFL